SVDLDYLFTILDALLAGDAAGMLQVADLMAARSLSFDAALQELAALFTRLQVAQLAPQAVADDLPERARILELAARLDPEFVQLGYQIAVHGRKELSLAPDDQAGFVMTLLRLHTFRPVQVGEVSMPRQLVQPKQVSAPLLAAQLAATPAVVAELPLAPVVPETPVAVAEQSPVESVSVESAAADANWHDILLALKLSGMARELGQHCELRSIGNDKLVLGLSPIHRHLQMKPAQDKL
ncbi:MAG: hypothetical protein J0626_08495, partial [Rhodospirillaceae bacterium]|nr:hypothetical protein [Rhodospirillaceae bacterium]